MEWTFPTYPFGKPINWEEIENRFSWFSEMELVPQDPIWHAEGNVQIHTKMVVESLLNLPEFQKLNNQDKQILFATALFHDIEKRSTTQTEIIDGVERITSPRHALKGEYSTRTILYKELNTPFSVREKIAKLVRYHGLPIWAMEKEDPRKAVIEASLVVNNAHLAIFATADILGRISKDKEEMLYNIALFKELCVDHNCYQNPSKFKSNYGRYLFLNKKEISPDYEPFEDLKFEVIMMSALPGSGKDTYIQKNLSHLPSLSLDSIRRNHNISPTDKKKNGKVIQMAKEQAKVFLRKKTTFVFNATNLTRDIRRKWTSLFMDYGAKVKIIYLEVPYKTLLRQNKNRIEKVPEVTIGKMINRLEIPIYNEAHEVVYITD